MNIQEALRALAEGKMIWRPGSWVLELQDATVPLLTQQLATGYGSEVINNNWLFCKFPLIADVPQNHEYAETNPGAIGAPYAFVPADMAATDWSIVE